MNYRFNKGEKGLLLFLHGWGGSLKSFECLEKYFFSLGYSTLSLDFFGFGKSAEPPANFTIFDYAFSIKNLLTKLNLQNATIISHSFGSRVAIILSALYNDYVKKLVIIDGAGIKPKFNLKTFIKVKKYKFLKKLAKIGLYKKEKLKSYGSNDYVLLSENMKQVFKNVIDADLTYLLKEIDKPTLIIWGKNDKETPLYMAKIMNKHIKDSGLIIYKNCGHFSYLEQPQKTKVIIQEFIKEKENGNF